MLAPDHRLHYGPAPSQLGDLWLPPAKAGTRSPLLVFFHGGWWQSAFNLDYCGPICRALRDAGLAVWSVEYRRVGEPGGGWPGTFQDAAAGFDFADVLARIYPIDLRRVVVAGHSAGGHLAFWVAGRLHVFEGSVLHDPQPKVPVRAAVSLAGVVDLRGLVELPSTAGSSAPGKEAVRRLLGGSPDTVPERYLAGDPRSLLPLNCPQTLVQGTADEQVPPQLAELWSRRARQQGETAEVVTIAGANHFDVVDPESRAWPRVRSAILHAVPAIV